MTDEEKRQWLDAPVEWDDYSDNPTLEEARSEREQIENEVKNELDNEKNQRMRNTTRRIAGRSECRQPSKPGSPGVKTCRKALNEK